MKPDPSGEGSAGIFSEKGELNGKKPGQRTGRKSHWRAYHEIIFSRSEGHLVRSDLFG